MLRRCAQRFNLSGALYLNPHAWKGLPADQVFELHQLRKNAMGKQYTPTDEERQAVLATVKDLSLAKRGPKLDYVYEIDNFTEKYMNNVPLHERTAAQKLLNVEVIGRGDTPHIKRRAEHLTRVSAYEMPLLAKFAQPYVAPKVHESPLQMTYYTDFSDETGSRHNRKVQVKVNANHLGLTPEQKHKFALLAGNKYNLDTSELTVRCDRYPELAQNARWLVETVQKLVAAAKDPSDTFADVPVDPRHMRYHVKKPEPKFPEEWKRPQDAPQQKHAVVREVVRAVKQKKDEEYLREISP